jgi:hypothetical protein
VRPRFSERAKELNDMIAEQISKADTELRIVQTSLILI